MSRSRSHNRFQGYLARQKRSGLRAVLPQFQGARENHASPVNSINEVLRRLSLSEIELDLMEAEA